MLLNRAPTLHRLGIQAFRPVLIEDLAIRIPPMVCTAFNADFDGDQMAVHLPLTVEAQFEAGDLMDAGKNLLKPANGEPIVSPTQDMVLGAYFLTRVRKGAKGEGAVLSNFAEVTLAYEFGRIDINAMIHIPYEGKMLETSYGRLIFNRVLPPDFGFVNEVLNKKQLSKLVARIIDEYGIESTQQYLNRIKDLGFEYATISALSWGMADTVIPKEKKGIIHAGEEKVALIESQYNDGLLTKKERTERIIEVWTDAREQVAKITPKALAEDSPVFAIIDSAARGSWVQTTQMMGMKGLVINPKGESIELPVKSSYKEGLSVLEYFISTHGARKGSTDTALKTATAGYLTRRLVDVSQDLLIREEECGSDRGITIIRKEGEEYGYSFADRLYSRTSLEEVRVDRKIVVRAGEVITRAASKQLQESKLDAVKVRSPIACKTLYGLCAACYGLDLSKNKPIHVGEAVGIVAAQSIGEPGTQLTMRTFHVGGIAGVDITHGLPRVEEVFEARPPKGKAPLARADGLVHEIEERGLAKAIRIKPTIEKTRKGGGKVSLKASFDEYLVPAGVTLFVKKGDAVVRGQALAEGPLDLREILAYRGVEAVEHYIVNEIQRIYIPQGSPINDKHIEIVVRQMLSRVVIKDPGDTEYMPGEILDRSRFTEINRDLRHSKRRPAKGILKVMGITRVALDSLSFLSAASFQETSRVLVNAAVEAKSDPLRGLKENVIIGRLIPAGTGLRGIPVEELDKIRAANATPPDVLAAALAANSLTPTPVVEAPPTPPVTPPEGEAGTAN